MSKFRRNKSKDIPAVSTAALPDIVFIVLSFFILVSQMKQTELQIKAEKPSGKETIVLDKNEAVDYVSAGIPSNSSFGTTVRVQLDDDIKANFLEIRNFLNKKRGARSDEENSKATVAITADQEDVTMAEIDQIENECKEAEALRLNYLTKKEVNR